MSKSSNILEFHLFADDTNLFLADQDIHNLENILNIELNKKSQWLYANKLSLNIDKTNFLVFHSAQKKVRYKLSLLIANKQIRHEKHVRYLGLIFDSNLNWKKHIYELGKKVSRGIGILSKI